MKSYSFLTNEKTLLVGLFAIQLILLPLIVGATYPWLTGDSNRYILLSDSLLTDGSFGVFSPAGWEPEAMRAPGYPFLIAAGSLISGGSNVGIILIQGALYLTSIWLVWRVTSNLLSRNAAVLFLLLASVYPFVIYNVGQISPEIPTLFLICLAVFFLQNPTNIRVAASAAAIALSAYFRPNLILLNAVLSIAVLIVDHRSWRKALLVLTVAAVIALPFCIRNYSEFGRFTPLPVAGGLGNSLLLTTWASRVSLYSLISWGMRGEITQELRDSGLLDQLADANREIGAPEDTVFVTVESYKTNETKIKANEILLKTALRNIREDPLSYGQVVLTNSVRMWFTSQLPERIPRSIRFLILAEGIVVFLLGIAGLASLMRTKAVYRNLVIVFLTGGFLYFVMTLSWLHTEARYTIPVRLFLLMFAAQAILLLSASIKLRSVGESS